MFSWVEVCLSVKGGTKKGAERTEVGYGGLDNDDASYPPSVILGTC